MSKTIILVAFIGMCLFQLLMPASTVWQMEEVVQTGETYRFRCAPVDPNDPFRGKYLTLSFADTVVIKSEDNWNSSETVYALIDPDFTDFVQIKTLSKTPPEENIPYVKARILRFHNNLYNTDPKAIITYDFSRFYIEEDEAFLAETLYNKASRNRQSKTYAVVKVKGSTAVLQDILIDEQSIYELVKAEQK